MSIQDSNRLPVLAAEISMAHQYVTIATRLATQKAIECGHLLIEAKKACRHGEWLPYLNEACKLSERTAQAYMQLARMFGHPSEEKAQRVADLGLREALKLAAKARTPEARIRQSAAKHRQLAALLDGMPKTQAMVFAMADMAESLADTSENAATIEELEELAEYAGKAATLFGEWGAHIEERAAA